jgi:signal transduction histidine kinase
MGRIKLSQLVLAFSIGAIVFQGAVSLLLMALLLNDTSMQYMTKQSRRSTEAIQAYMDSVVEDLSIKVVLISGHKRIIDFSRYRLTNLLKNELEETRKSLGVDYLSVHTDSEILSFSGNKALAPSTVIGTDTESESEPSASIGQIDGKVYLSVQSPIYQDGVLTGYLTARLAIDERLLSRMEGIVNAKILFASDQLFIYNTRSWETQVLKHLQQDVAANELKPGIWQNRFYIEVIPVGTSSTPVGTFYNVIDGSSIIDLARSAQITMVFVLLVTSFLALTGGYLLYSTLFRKPLNTIMDGIHQITMGNFSHRIVTTVDNEFSELSNAINKMSDALVVRDEQIGELNRYLNLILQSAVSGIIVTDDEGRITQCNSAAQDITSLPALPVGELATETLPRQIAELILDTPFYDSADTGHEVILQSPRNYRIIGVQISPLKDDKMQTLGLVIVLDDRTEFRNLQEQLIVSERLAALGEMASGVAHQIRNPLGVMKVSAEMLQGHLEQDTISDADRELVSLILVEVDTLQSVIQRFLHFGRPMTVQMKWIHIGTCINDVLTMIPASIDEEHPCRFSLQIPESIPPVLADETLLGQALVNIITNSLEAVRNRDGNITISADISGLENNVRISIRDNGPGIPEEIMTHIMNPFFTTKPRGTGLGLSIVHRCLEAQKISMEIVSEPDSGCVVSLQLAAAVQE